ncbi:ATP-binding protein [Stieleria varia]|uniref:AAA+ ATPase domain-containing protein n=1 Tax=Stieleria varia TaxID=2528005 RepID=A0A5C5ZYC1_9BACT|nr:ATP-binding protein [Stieleria varia]TWT91313.1 hypothetical protein Pla52n_66470 [Stieleria varia]
MTDRFTPQPTNPFATSRTSPGVVPYRFAPGRRGGNPQAANMHLETLLAALKECRRGLIVGPHGTGKTTLVHSLLPKLQRAYPMVSFNHLSSDPSDGWFKRFIARLKHYRKIRGEMLRLPGDGLLVVDGWEQLSRYSRYRLARSAFLRNINLLATAHRRITGWTVVAETSTSPEMIQSLAGDLLAETPHEIKKLVADQIKSRRVSERTNVRELWFDMYDVVAKAQTESRRDKSFGEL